MTQPDPHGLTNAQVARTDHDLLIVINTKLDLALSQQADLERRMRVVESKPAGDPVVHARVDDHEKRLRWVEARLYAVGAAGVVLGSGGGWGLTTLLGH